MNLKQKQYSLLKAGALVLGCSFAPQINLQAQENDWPCAQVLVTTVSPAVVWPYPLEDKSADRWLTNAEVESVASELVSGFYAGDDEIALIDGFLAGIGLSKRSDVATDLFMAILSKYNSKRQTYINGIQKFTGKQKKLAERLGSLLGRRDALVAENKPVEELTEEIAMTEQVFRNRENILADLCEHPVRIEENLGLTARKIAEYAE